MDLKQTYAAPDLHDEWTSIYRTNPLQARFNSEMLKRVLLELPQAPGRFLDAGCGTGDHALHFLHAGYSGVGVDLSVTALQRAKCRLEKSGTCFHLVQGRLEALPLADVSFDFVHCRGVLMHVPDWQGALRHLCRVLKPNGTMVVMDNNDRSLEAKLRLLRRRFVKHRSRLLKTEGGLEFWSEVNGEPFLLRIANVRKISAVMRDCGVALVRVLPAGFFGIGGFPAGWARNLAIYLNRMYFAARLPASPSAEVILLGRKT